MDSAFGPAVLLRLKAIDFHRDLAGHLHVREKEKAPPCQLSAVAQVEVFCKRVVLPASGLDDGRFAPDAARPVKVKEASRAAARCVLNNKVAV